MDSQPALLILVTISFNISHGASPTKYIYSYSSESEFASLDGTPRNQWKEKNHLKETPAWQANFFFKYPICNPVKITRHHLRNNDTLNISAQSATYLFTVGFFPLGTASIFTLRFWLRAAAVCMYHLMIFRNGYDLPQHSDSALVKHKKLSPSCLRCSLLVLFFALTAISPGNLPSSPLALFDKETMFTFWLNI